MPHDITYWINKLARSDVRLVMDKNVCAIIEQRPTGEFFVTRYNVPGGQQR